MHTIFIFFSFFAFYLFVENPLVLTVTETLLHIQIPS